MKCLEFKAGTRFSSEGQSRNVYYREVVLINRFEVIPMSNILSRNTVATPKFIENISIECLYVYLYFTLTRISALKKTTFFLKLTLNLFIHEVVF